MEGSVNFSTLPLLQFNRVPMTDRRVLQFGTRKRMNGELGICALLGVLNRGRIVQGS